MNDAGEGSSRKTLQVAELPGARVGRRRWHFPFVWMVPFVAAVVTGYLMVERVREFGPEITIRFKDVSGLKSGQTLLKYRGVPIGDVKAIELDKDLQQALVRVRLRRAAADIARKESVFWIVRPEVGLGNISGLGTVITGPEIGVHPGRGEAATEFIGRDTAPMTVEHKGLSVILRTPHLGALKANAPVYYRGVEVGMVQESRLSGNATAAEVRVLIRPGYARLVHTGSRFWKAGGIDVNLGLFSGLEINMESLRSLIAGGVAFATPPADVGARPAASGSVFPLFDKPEKEWLEWAPEIAVQPEPVPQSMQ